MVRRKEEAKQDKAERSRKPRSRSADFLANVKVFHVASPFTLRVTQLILGSLEPADNFQLHIENLRHASKEVAALPADVRHLVDQVRRWEDFPSNPLDPDVVRNGGQPYKER
jgi:hypothetical protein